MASMDAIEIVTEGLHFPEGPVAMADGSVVVVEIGAGRLTRVFPDGRKQTVADTGGGPNGAAIGPDGACYVCNNGGFSWQTDDVLGAMPTGPSADYKGGWIERVELDSGKVERLYDRSPNGPLTGPNDIVFDAHGGMWFTDLGKQKERDAAHGGIYYARTDGSSISEVIFPMMAPNGIGLSPDGSTLYAAETFTGRLWAFRIAGPGQIDPEPVPSVNGGRFVFGPSNFQFFDSLAVEKCGNVAVATPFGGGVSVIAPDGKLVEFVEMPDLMTTNICFGGTDLRTAHITLSSTGKLAKLIWKRPGLKLNY